MASEDNSVEEVQSRSLTPEEQYFFECSYKEPVESIARIEDVAKFLVGASTTTSGLFLAAFKLSQGSQTVSGVVWFVPFVLWAFSIIAFVFVLFPEEYPTGKDEPASWRQAFRAARRWKYWCLFTGAVLFICGVFSAVLPFAC
jgi:hypothetical protein